MNKPTRLQAGKMLHAVLQSLLKEPATINYPVEESRMPDRFRGRLKFYPEKCSGCKLCMRDCPANAIKITRISKTEIEAEIDMAKCIYCAQCVDVCPRKALEATEDFELAETSRDKLVVVYRSKPQEEPSEGEEAKTEPAATDPAKE